MIDEFRQQALEYTTERATVWLDKDGLTPEEARRFASLLDKGIRDLEQYLGLGFNPKAWGSDKVCYLVSSSIRIAYTSWGPTVFLPLWRVKDHSAPYLHETTHLLLNAWRAERPAERARPPLWLEEGFASFVQSYVSEHVGGWDHLFATEGNRGIDEEAGALIETAAGVDLLPFVGGEGRPPGIFRDRERVARPFYVLSQSFVKHLVERAGRETVQSLCFVSDTSASLAEKTGESAEKWRVEWLARLPRPKH